MYWANGHRRDHPTSDLALPVQESALSTAAAQRQQWTFAQDSVTLLVETSCGKGRVDSYR